MTYVIVTAEETIIGRPFTTFDTAFAEAGQMFGDDVATWVARNIRIEEYR
jgi:hypothetical protein